VFYKILISDRSFNAVAEIQHTPANINWDYNRIGGCGEVSFIVPKKFCRNVALSPSFNIQISRLNPSTKAFDLWYQGRIESVLPNVRGEDETLQIKGMGYQSQLQDVDVDKDYTSTEISVIVKDILDTFITPDTDITYDAGDIEATSFTPDSIAFNTNSQDAMRTLADITGTREWGVDADRKFFFKARSSSVGFRYPMGGKILNFAGDDSTRETVNRAIVIGGGDPPFTATYNDETSQLKWGIRAKRVQNSSITTSAVASQFADSLFAEFNDVVRRARVDLLDEVQIEATLPIPLFRMLPALVRYNERRYGEFLYSGYIDYQVNRVNYNIDDSGNLIVSIQMGQLRPSIAEDISRLEYKLGQLTQQNL
jgi:hypothetical protein